MTDDTDEEIAYWNLKFHDEDGERETVRGLTETKKDTLMTALDREGVHAQAIGYNADGSKQLDSESVNNDPAFAGWDRDTISEPSDGISSTIRRYQYVCQ